MCIPLRMTAHSLMQNGEVNLLIIRIIDIRRLKCKYSTTRYFNMTHTNGFTLDMCLGTSELRLGCCRHVITESLFSCER
ncbi:hypothetical protein SFRURICE_002618, partial [Spodoptera frugiperda]